MSYILGPTPGTCVFHNSSAIAQLHSKSLNRLALAFAGPKAQGVLFAHQPTHPDGQDSNSPDCYVTTETTSSLFYSGGVEHFSRFQIVPTVLASASESSGTEQILSQQYSVGDHVIFCQEVNRRDPVEFPNPLPIIPCNWEGDIIEVRKDSVLVKALHPDSQDRHILVRLYTDDLFPDCSINAIKHAPKT